MMELQQRVEGLVKWGHALHALIEELESDLAQENGNPLRAIVQQAYRTNAWFTPEFSLRSLKSLAQWLDKSALEAWLKSYPELESSSKSLKTIGVVMAGNIPAVGFHDLISVLVSGNRALVKLSSDDAVIIPFLVNVLLDVSQDFKPLVQIGYKFQEIDAVIATGSNNSARYFDYYFGKYPHIIRKNRNSLAILNGNETAAQLSALGDDIFSYFGLGCRNVSKLMVPEGYAFDAFFESIEVYGEKLMQHNKYMNNYDYHRALYLLNNEPFLTNNFLSLRQSDILSTPVSVLHYDYYAGTEDLAAKIEADTDRIQCIVGGKYLPLGTSQQPGLSDYADGVDTLRFLIGLQD